MPRVMLGTGGYEGLSGRAGRAAILAALKMGYRGIDTSEMNRNLTDVRWACTRSGLAREDYFLVVKIPPWSHGHDGVLQSFRRQASQLAVDYVDLLLIQWPHVWSLEQRDWGPEQWSRPATTAALAVLARQDSGWRQTWWANQASHCRAFGLFVTGNGAKDCHMPMLSPVRDGKTGTLSQVQACQRQVSELRASLSLLAERCGCLEDVHKGAIERLRDFGSPKPGATLEQLKKQSMAKVKALQSRHGELMSKLQEELSLSCERSEPTPTTEKLKTPAVLKGAAGVPSPDLAKPEAVNGAGVAAPLTLESENGHEQTDVSSVTVMPIDGRVGKLNSRLRFHDIQAKSAPDRLTPQGLPMARNSPESGRNRKGEAGVCGSVFSRVASDAPNANASVIQGCLGTVQCLFQHFRLEDLALRVLRRASQTKASLRGETWRAMEELFNSGRARAIGVSNHTIEDMEAILQGCVVAPMVMQGESHPHWPNRSVRDWCRKQSIAFQGYAPFGGQETERNSGHRAVDDPTVLSVAEKHQLTPFQVCMQWNQARNSSTVVKSKISGHLRENLAACGEMRCTATDLGRIDERAKEFLKYGPCYWGHNDMDYLHPWKDEEKMWDAMLPGGQEVCGRI
ncbi:AKR4C10 [Symbiodinium microadriaticum]|nr:AKR4C10 [Symbiodinium microadriaticum]